jgi:hypothetical protein
MSRWTIRTCRECGGVVHAESCRYVGPLTNAPCEEVEVVRADAVEPALKFYADPQTWNHLSPRGTVTTSTIAVQDGGKHARRALHELARTP